MLPRCDGRAVLVEPLAAARLAAHWGLPPQAAYEYVRLFRIGLEGALQLRLVGVDSALPTQRPALDSRFDGPLGVGYPVRDLKARNIVVDALGFGSTAGLTLMAFPRADGSTYDIGPTTLALRHWRGAGL